MSAMSLRRIDRRLLTILLIVFVQQVGAAMILPILPLFARREFNLPPQTITLLVSSFFAAQFLAGPYLGRLSDRVGRLPVLLLSQIGTVFSFILLGLAPSYQVLFAARILDGITGGNIIVAQAYITDVSPPEKRTEALSYIFAVFGLGFIFGPALGGALSAALGPRPPYLIAAGAAGITVLLTWLALDESLTGEQRQARQRSGRPSLNSGAVMRNAPLILILVIAFAGQFAFGLLQSTFALFGEAVLFAGYSEEQTNLGIGLILAVVGLAQLLTQTVLLPWLIRLSGDARLVIVGVTVRGLAMLAWATVTSPIPAAAIGPFFAVGQGLMMPPLQSLSTRTVPDDVRGGVLGLYQSSVGLATIISTAMAGILFASSPALPYWIGGTLSLLVVVPALSLVRRFRPAGKAVSAESAGTD